MSAERTTIRATIDELLVKLRANLTADPPTAGKPFRQVVAGDPKVTDLPRPFLAIHLTRARAIGTADGDKLMEVSATMRVVTDVLGAAGHGELLDRVAAVDDFMDSLLDAGVIDGAEGFDDRIWTFQEPNAGGGARVTVGSAAHTMVVKVMRGHNREEA